MGNVVIPGSTTKMRIIDIVPYKNPKSMKPVELLPPLEVTWKLDRVSGWWIITSAVPLNYMWDTDVDILETKRMFMNRGLTDEEVIEQELMKAIKDLLERLGWIYAANHGYLDTAMGTIRFKR